MNGLPRAPERARLDALMYRMLGGLLLLGAGILFGLTLGLLRLPQAMIDGEAMLVLPGPAGRHGLATVAVPVVGSAALVLGLGGLAALALARRAVPFGPASPRPNRSAIRRPALVLLGGVALLVAVLLRR